MLAPSSPSPEPVVLGAAEAPTLPDTPPDAVGRRFESFGLSPPAPPTEAMTADQTERPGETPEETHVSTTSQSTGTNQDDHC